MKRQFVTRLAFLLLLLTNIHSIAQRGVSINTTGALPDSNSILDVSSTTKGALFPRMTTAQRTAIIKPPIGLTVFDLDNRTYWYYAGSEWVEITTNKEEWSSHGNRNSSDTIDVWSTQGNSISGGEFIGTTNDQPLLFKTNGTERMRVAENGNVGIGNSNPNALLQFANLTGNRKIVLWELENNDHRFYGFGINGGTLRYQISDTLNQHIFYAGVNGNLSKELMRIKGNGNIGIGVTNPTHTLDIHKGSPRSGTHADGPLPLYVTGNIGSHSNGIEFRHSNGAQGIGFGFNTIYAAGSSISQNLSFRAKGPEGGMIFQTDDFNTMVIDANKTVWINSRLQFPNPYYEPNEKMIVLWDENNQNEYAGFGISPGTLRYQISNIGAAHGFYVGTSPTSSNELMRIQGDGNVGVGIPTANNKMDINLGAARTGTTHATGLPMYVTSNNILPSSKGVEFRHSNGEQGIGFGYNTIYATGSQSNQDLGLLARGSEGILKFTTNSTERMRIQGNGNVGIGIPTANNKMDINLGAARTSTLHATGLPMYVTGDNILPSSKGVEFRHSNGQQGIGFGYNTIYATGYLPDQDLGLMARGSAGILKFSTDNTERMRIRGNGNVGIDVINPQNRIDIHHGSERIDLFLHATGRPLYVTGDLGEQNNGIEFRDNNATQGIGFGYNTIYATGDLNNQDLGLRARGWEGRLKFIAGETERMRILGNGNVGIGTITPVTRLQISNGTDAYWTDNSGYLVLGETSTTNIVMDNNEITARNNGWISTLFMQADGGGVRIGGNTPTSYQLELSSTNAAKPGSSNWWVASDSRLKKDIEPFTDGLDLIRKINPVWFRYNGLNGITDTSRFAGIIAQEIQKIAPYMISTTKSADREGESYLSYDANSMTYILINAVKEQQIQIQQQQDRIDTLEKELKAESTAEVEDMKAMMAQMQQEIQQLKRQD